MGLTLLESNRRVFHITGSSLASILVHAGLFWFAVSATQDGQRLPTTERDARVFFLLPPDRVDVRVYQSEIFQLGKLGLDLGDGKHLAPPNESWLPRKRAHPAPSLIPFGPPPIFVPDTAFSVLDVDQMAERYDSSAAPVYPRELLAIGLEGLVQTTYVVDTTGMVDTASVEVVKSDDPRFTRSVRDALSHMRFRPAKRAGKTVRQLVEQRFRFKIQPPPDMVKQVSLQLVPHCRPHPFLQPLGDRPMTLLLERYPPGA